MNDLSVRSSGHTSGRFHRILRGLVLGISMVWVGFVAGAALGARFFVPEGSGMAGPAIALGYGLLGAAVAGAAAIPVAWRASPGVLRGATIVAVVLALTATAFVGLRVRNQAVERRDRAVLEQPLPPTAGFRIEAEIAAEDTKRPFRELTVDGDSWTASFIAVVPEAAVCKTLLTGEEAARLLALLPRLEARFQNPPAPCFGDEDVRLYTLRWQPNPGVRDLAFALRRRGVQASRDCLRVETELRELHHLLSRIPLDAQRQGRLECAVEAVDK